MDRVHALPHPMPVKLVEERRMRPPSPFHHSLPPLSPTQETTRQYSLPLRHCQDIVGPARRASPNLERVQRPATMAPDKSDNAWSWTKSWKTSPALEPHRQQGVMAVRVVRVRSQQIHRSREPGGRTPQSPEQPLPSHHVKELGGTRGALRNHVSPVLKAIPCAVHCLP